MTVRPDALVVSRSCWPQDTMAFAAKSRRHPSPLASSHGAVRPFASGPSGGNDVSDFFTDIANAFVLEFFMAMRARRWALRESL